MRPKYWAIIAALVIAYLMWRQGRLRVTPPGGIATDDISVYHQGVFAVPADALAALVAKAVRELNPFG